MDPGVGRRWMRLRQLQDETYIHAQAVPADAWREWAGTDGFIKPLRRRIGDLGIHPAPYIDKAKADTGWRSLATLDAATRLLASLGRAQSSETSGPSSIMCFTLEPTRRSNVINT